MPPRSVDYDFHPRSAALAEGWPGGSGENIYWVARMLGHKVPVVALERSNRFVPNLTRTEGKALLAAGLAGGGFPGK